MNAWITQIEVSEENGVIDFSRQIDRKIYGGQGFAVTRTGARDCDRVPAIHPQFCEHTGAQYLVYVGK